MLIAAFGKPLSLLVFSDSKATGLLIAFSFTLLFQGFIEVPMVFIRARQKPVLFIIFSTLKLMLQLSLNIYLVVLLHMKVEGVIYSALISGFAMSIILLVYTLKITGLKFSIEKAKILTSFSMPLVLTGLVSFFLTFGDRYFLRYYCSMAEFGIYSLAYKFGFLLMFIIVQPFSNHWDSEKYIIMKSPNAKQIFQQTFLAYSMLTIAFVVIISIFVKNLLMIMSEQAFWSAYTLVPVVMLAYIFNALVSFTNLGIFAANKTMEITYGTVIGAVAVGVSYFVLIPKFGPAGAAWATVIGFGSRFFYVNWRAQRLYDMELPWAKVLSVMLIGTCRLCTFASRTGQTDPLTDV